MIKKAICKNCGVVNEINLDSLGDDSDDWLYCDLPTGFEWHLPAGKITPIYGDPIYISGLGEHLSRDAYILKYDIDPEIAYQMMRERLHIRGRAPKTTNKEKKESSRTVPAAATATRSHDLLDDDDWTS